MDEYVGIIRIFAGDFTPSGWLMCDGTLYNISDYAALFAVCSNFYGGDGKTTFAVPDLRGRVPIGMGEGAGIPAYALGEMGGFETATIAPFNLPAHNHTINGNVQMLVNDNPAQIDSPVSTYLAQPSSNAYYAGGSGIPGGKSADLDVNLSLGNTGNSVPFEVNPPYVGLNYIICVSGIFPLNSANS
jgi:microcystin-dependent protein